MEFRPPRLARVSRFVTSKSLSEVLSVRELHVRTGDAEVSVDPAGDDMSVGCVCLNAGGTQKHFECGERAIRALLGVALALFQAGLELATIGGVSVPVAYAGAQGQYPGFDQVNLQIPAGIHGTLNLTLTADGQTSNAVQLAVQ